MGASVKESGRGEGRGPKPGPKPEPRVRPAELKRPRPDGPRKALTNIGGPSRFSGDASLKALLEEAATPPADFDERALTHGFHTWPARLHPFTARTLIAAAPPGPIADPFMGGGTVPLEAMLAGRAALGNDLNPVGHEVAWVRTRRLSPGDRAGLIGRCHQLIKAARQIREDARPPALLKDRVGRWFDPQALQEVWSLAAVLEAWCQKVDDIHARILRAALSSIIVKVSRQVSDTVIKVDRERTDMTPKGRVDHWLKKRVDELAEQLGAFADAVPAGTVEPRLVLGDARVPPVDIGKFAAIISSPPYPGVYDYLEHHRLRCAVLGFPLAEATDREIGSRRASERLGVDIGNSRYVDDLGKVLANYSKQLQPEGFVALMIGDGQVGDRVTPVLPLLEKALPAGLEIRAALSQPRPIFAAPTAGMRPDGGRAIKKMKEEHLVYLARRG
jgi:hypothetical protein